MRRLLAWLRAEWEGLASYPEPGDWDRPESTHPSPAGSREREAVRG